MHGMPFFSARSELNVMDITLTRTIGYLAVAILVAIIARRAHLPYTVGLVITGIGLAVTGLETGVMLTHDFIFDVILPPLLFEAALSIRWRELRRDLLPVVVLSTFGVLVSTIVVAALASTPGSAPPRKQQRDQRSGV